MPLLIISGLAPRHNGASITAQTLEISGGCIARGWGQSIDAFEIRTDFRPARFGVAQGNKCSSDIHHIRR